MNPKGSVNSNFDFMQVHGDEDQVVGFHWGEHSHSLLQTFGLQTPPQFLAIEVSHIVIITCW